MRIRPSVPSRSRTADAARVAIPLLIAFAAPSSLVVERDRPSQFPILGNRADGRRRKRDDRRIRTGADNT